MHSNVLPWQQLCDEHGGELLMIKRPANWDWTSAIESAIAGGEVAICALPPCHWCDGSLVNLDRVGAACRKGDVALVIDGTQWIGAAPTIDAATLGACFVACSVHKWLLGPYGCCLCYAPRSFWKDAHPIEHHDRNREGAQHVECLPMDDSGRYPSEFMNGARRLDSGGRPSYIIMPMIRESLNILVKQLTVPRVTAELRRYTTELARRAKELGFHVPPHHAPNIVGLWPAAGMPAADEIVRALAEPPVPVLVSERLGFIRLSPHIWNSRQDMEHLFRKLADIVGLPDAVSAPASSTMHVPKAVAESRRSTSNLLNKLSRL